jgi:hypothetical protein
MGMISRKRRSRKWEGSAEGVPENWFSGRVTDRNCGTFDPSFGAAAEQGEATRRLGVARRVRRGPGRGRRTPEEGDGAGSGRPGRLRREERERRVPGTKMKF